MDSASQEKIETGVTEANSGAEADENDGKSKVLETGEKAKPVEITNVQNATVIALNKIKELASTRSFHQKLLEEEASVGFAVLSLDSSCREAVSLSLDILQLLAQYPENRAALSNIVHIFDALQSVIDKPDQEKELSKRALWVSSVLKQKGLEIHRKKKSSRRRPLGEKNPSVPSNSKADRSKRNSKNVYLRIADVCIESNRNEITETLRKIEGIISITFVVHKSVCLILSHMKVPSEFYGKAVANMGFECELVAWDSNHEEVWIRQYPDKWEKSSIGGKENEPEYLPDSDDEKDKSVGDQALVLEGERKKKGGGWLTSAASFLQKSFYW
jgi:armadillo repeat-containing protein 1